MLALLKFAFKTKPNVANENQSDVRIQRQIGVNLQHWTDVVLWLEMKIRSVLTSTRISFPN